MDDLISRRTAIDALMKRDKELRNFNWYDKPWVECECNGIDYALGIVSALPSAQPALDEWCTDCSEYDQERHCCPRWNRVIRTTLNDMKGENNDTSLDN